MNYDVLKERYELLCVENTDMGVHMPALVQHVLEVDADVVIELGTRYGASTIAFLYGLYGDVSSHISVGRLWSVDCSFPVTDPETGIELLNSQGPLGCVPYWCFLLGYDTNEMILQALPYSCDILFIDTNHVYEETLIELQLYAPRVNPGGRILLHDTSLETTGNAVTPQPPFPVRTAVQEFCEEKRWRYSFVEDYPGMGTIYIPN